MPADCALVSWGWQLLGSLSPLSLIVLTALGRADFQTGTGKGAHCCAVVHGHRPSHGQPVRGSCDCRHRCCAGYLRVAWEAHGEELVRQIHQKPYQNAPARIDTETSEAAAQPYLSPGERLLVFAIVFGLGAVAFIVELKTGYQVDHKSRFAFSGWSITQVHGAWSWDEVWTHLPDELSGLFFLPFCVLAFVVVELSYRFGRRR
jgi:hypothetical protein